MRIYKEVFNIDIAEGITLSNKKVRYMLNFGIAPDFKSLLFKDIAESWYAICFEETTTKQVNKLLYICISYWSKMKEKVVYFYCDFYFLGHVDGCTILKLLLSLKENNLNIQKFIQISMGGPNTICLYAEN